MDALSDTALVANKTTDGVAEKLLSDSSRNETSTLTGKLATVSAELLNKELSLSKQVAPGSNSFFDKVSRESILLGSLPNTVSSGFKERVNYAANHKLETATEVATAVAIGAAMTILAKNPTVLGKTLAPVINFGMTNTTKLFGALTVLDMGRRVAAPVLDTWDNPHNLEANQKILGRNIGAMAFDYPLVMASGYIGSRLGTGLATLTSRLPSELHSQAVKPEVINLEDGTIATKGASGTTYRTTNGIEVTELKNGGRVIKLPSGETETSTFRPTMFDDTNANRHYALKDGSHIDVKARGDGICSHADVIIKTADGKTATASQYDLFTKKGPSHRVELLAGDPRLPKGKDLTPKLGWNEEAIEVGTAKLNNSLPSWTTIGEELNGNRTRIGVDINEYTANAFAKADLIYSRLDGSKVYQWLPDFMSKPASPGAGMKPVYSIPKGAGGLSVGTYVRRFDHAPLLEGVPPYLFNN